MTKSKHADFIRRALSQKTELVFTTDELRAGVAQNAINLLKEVFLDGTAKSIEWANERSVLRISGNNESVRIRITILCLVEQGIEAYGALKRLAYEEGREHVCFCIVPGPEYELFSEVDTQGLAIPLAATVIPIYPADLKALVNGKISGRDLFEYKLYRRLIQEKSDPETQFNELTFAEFTRKKVRAQSQTVIEAIPGYNQSVVGESVPHPLLGDITQELDTGRGCLLIGPSSSGKTVLAEQILGRQANRGDKTVYLNLSRQSGQYIDALGLLSSGGDRSVCVVVDDLQSNPSLARHMTTVASAYRRVGVGARPRLIGICWPAFAREAVVWFEDCRPFTIYAHHVREDIIAHAINVPKATKDAIRRTYGDDLLLLSLFLREAARTGREPTPDAVVESIWRERVKPELGGVAKRVALIVSSLGRFDISAPVEFVIFQASTDSHTIDALIASGLLRKTASLLSIGHRSLAGVICDWLSKDDGWAVFSHDNGPENVEGVVLRYLRSVDAGRAIETLRGLQARVGFKTEDQLNVRAAALISIWQVFIAIVERLEHQQEGDPNWGEAPSSAVFAARAFAEIGRHQKTEECIRFLRSCWSTRDNQIGIQLEKLSTRYDFEQIKSRMIEEDASVTRWQGTKLSGENLDIERFHRTWVLGLILGAEAASTSQRLPLQKLAEMVEMEAAPDGGFYPARVPWSTARVLLGLAACGRTIHTSAVVEKAVNWLKRPVSEGGASTGEIWESGTGTWNTTIETTAMVLTALIAVGVDWSEPALSTARSYLLSAKPMWTAPGKEMDCALALQAFLATGGNWEDIALDVQRLCQWAKAETVWQSATKSAKESLAQSCRVAQIASHLVDIGWTAIKADLPAFLDALATPKFQWTHISTAMSQQTPSQLPRDATPAEDRELYVLKGLGPFRLGELAVVGNYSRFDEQSRNRLVDRVRDISRGLLNNTVIHENFLIWAAPGTGKSFLVQEIARTLAGTVEYVEINFAAMSRDEIASRIKKIESCAIPVLTLIDEVDARPTETWQYEDVFSLLDLNLRPASQAVFVLIGSSPFGLQNMIEEMRKRPKGSDLLDRIPETNRFEIPAPMIEDKIAIILSTVATIAREKGAAIADVEKLALYYALKNEGLRSPRQLRDLVQFAALRIGAVETHLRYEYLFSVGDRTNQTFFASHINAAQELSGVYLSIA